MRELAREKETALEIVCDRENTIAKFRSFVNQVCLVRVFKFDLIFLFERFYVSGLFGGSVVDPD
jgi:hypothetical protein